LSNGKNGKHAPTFQQLIAARRLICRRYYPEGNFGYVILFVAFVVNTLTHGLQLSAYFFLMPSGKRFKVDEVKCLGKCLPYSFRKRVNYDIHVRSSNQCVRFWDIELKKALGRQFKPHLNMCGLRHSERIEIHMKCKANI
jgi:hypothetical protein